VASPLPIRNLKKIDLTTNNSTVKTAKDRTYSEKNNRQSRESKKRELAIEAGSLHDEEGGLVKRFP